MTTIDVIIPLRTVPGINAREHHMARHKRVKQERETTAAALLSHGARGPMPVTTVTFCRVSPQLCDDDNLAGAMKHVRDEIAKCLGLDDSPRGGVEWRYTQVRGPAKYHCVRVTIETRETEVAA